MVSPPTSHAPNAQESGGPLTVVIGDDSPVVARGLEALINEHEGIVVVASAADRDSLVAAVALHKPDVVVADLRMPPTKVDEGIQVLRRIEAKRMRTAFIIFSEYRDPAVAAQLLVNQEAGRGYLLKQRLTSAAELHEAILAVASGGTVIDPSLVVEMLGMADSPLRDATAPQREVLALIAEGLSNEAIAERLNITEWAVEKRVRALFRSLGLDDSPATNRRVAAAVLYLSSRSEAPG